MELLVCRMIERLNDYAGLFSLLAVLAATIVPVVIYRKTRKNEREDMRDELKAMNDVSGFPMTEGEREYYTKRTSLEKKLRRK